MGFHHLYQMNVPLAVIDIGAKQITCMIAEHNAQTQLKLCGIGCSKTQGVHREMIIDSEQLEKAVASAMARAEKLSEIKIQQVILSFSSAALYQEEMTVSQKLQDAPLDRESLDNWLRKAYLGFVSASEGFFSDHHSDQRTILHCLQKAIKHNGSPISLDALPQLTRGKLEVTLNMISINKTIYDTLIFVFNRLNISVARITASPYSDFWALHSSMILDSNLLLIDFASRFITASHFDNCDLQRLHRNYQNSWQ